MPDDLITDLETVRTLTHTLHDDFEVLRHQLQNDNDLTDDMIDAEVERIAQPIINAIDCTECGNCCRSLDVYLTPDDAQRLADGIDVPLDTIETRYIDHESAQQVNEWGKFKQQPCAFLGDDNLCRVYEHRPHSCRTYPVFTPYFRWLLADTIEGAAICPIIFNVLRQMTTHVDTMQQGIKKP